MAVLVKHPAESRDYVFDFGGLAGPYGGRRGNRWCLNLLPDGGTLAAPATPMVVLGLVSGPTGAVTQERADGTTPSDLVLGPAALDGTSCTVRVGGGTAGKRYFLACSAAGADGQALVVRGELAVSDRW